MPARSRRTDKYVAFYDLAATFDTFIYPELSPYRFCCADQRSSCCQHCSAVHDPKVRGSQQSTVHRYEPEPSVLRDPTSLARIGVMPRDGGKPTRWIEIGDLLRLPARQQLPKPRRS